MPVGGEFSLWVVIGGPERTVDHGATFSLVGVVWEGDLTGTLAAHNSRPNTGE